MSTTELESLRLDAEVTAKLQAVISSDQLDDDNDDNVITEKLAELYGGKRPDVTPADAKFLEGKKIEVDAVKVGKFKGKWTKDLKAGPSKGKLYYRRKLKGRYVIVVNLTQKTTIIVFRKLLRTDPKPPGEAEEPEEPEDYDEEPQRPPLPDAVFKGKGIVSSFVGGAGHGRWIVHI